LVDKNVAGNAKNLLASSLEGSVSRRSVRDYFRRHSYLLARRISERNGASGEHYIGHSGEQLTKILISSIGAGIIVVPMAILKLWLMHNPFPPLIHALMIWAVYSMGFLAMQFLGYTLATKLPSFTANYLANRLREQKDHNLNEGLREEVRLLIRSQSTALAGNILGLVPLVVFIVWMMSYFSGKGLLLPHEAANVLNGLNPVFSLTIFYGALTGVELWLSSLIGGAFENWIVYRRVPEAIAKSEKLCAAIGAEGAGEIAESFLKHAAGFAGNVALGFLFGFVPFFGVIMGLNLDGKHVTISASQALFAAFNLTPADNNITMVTAALAGLLFVGLMNLLVSFSIALLIAAKARGVRYHELLSAFLVNQERA
jgi:site-specific recombinase